MNLRHLLYVICACSFLLASPAWTQDDTTEANDFTDRQLLIDTWVTPENLSQLEQDIIDAQQAINDAPNDISEEDLAALNQTLTDAENALSAAQVAQSEETAEVELLVAQLSDEQVFALNRALNNSRHNRFPLDLNPDQLQFIIDENYNRQQINAYTKSIEEEAKFRYFAERFENKAATSGDDKFLTQADRMLEKSISQKERFMSKATRKGSTESTDNTALSNAKSDAKSNAKGEAKNLAQLEAKAAAREAAKEVRKEQAKNKNKNL